MNTQTKYLGDLVRIIGGGTPSRNIDEYWGGDIPWATVKDITGTVLTSTQERITDKGLKNSASNLIAPGAIIIPTRMGLGKAAINKIPVAINQDLKALFIINDKEINLEYLKIFILSKSRFFEKQGKGATVKGFKIDVLHKLMIPLPPLEDQVRIASLLSRIEELIAKRKESIRLLDEFVKSTFLEMFGDPVRNEKGWEKKTIKEISTRFSDGPFGSNLKTEHYSETGIRVIRLQNIGINTFLDDDKFFIDIKHYEKVLLKYTCYPGDVVIATMGTPNVRACIIPNTIEKAINKADCVLCRTDSKFVNPFYIVSLLNQPAFLLVASSSFHGQTRTRISMGQLSQIEIQVPPVNLQNKFATVAKKIEAMKLKYQDSLSELEKLYGAVSQRAFRGEM
jgi:type I restriction enzyme S subunit